MIQKYVDKDVPHSFPSIREVQRMLERNQSVQKNRQYISRVELMNLFGDRLGSTVHSFACRKLNHAEQVKIQTVQRNGNIRTQWVRGHNYRHLIKVLEKHEQYKQRPITWIDEFPFIIKTLKKWSKDDIITNEVSTVQQ